VRKRRFEEGIIKDSNGIEVISVDGRGRCVGGRVGNQCSDDNAIQFAM